MADSGRARGGIVRSAALKMAMSEADRLAEYLEHLHARVRARQHRSPPPTKSGRAILPASISSLCGRDPADCLDLIVRALAEPLAPEAMAAVGDGLLEAAQRERGQIADRVAEESARTRNFVRPSASGSTPRSIRP